VPEKVPEYFTIPPSGTISFSVSVEALRQEGSSAIMYIKAITAIDFFKL
jgi:hypothetical protein